MDNTYTHIGLSNNKHYPILKVKEKNIGLVELEGWNCAVWCLFEKIVTIKTFKNKLPKKSMLILSKEKVEIKL